MKYQHVLLCTPLTWRYLICSDETGFPLPCYCLLLQFSVVSNIIPGFFGFALFLFVIGPENSRHFLNQSDAKPKPIATWLLASSRALVTCVFPRFDYMRFPALWLACL